MTTEIPEHLRKLSDLYFSGNYLALVEHFPARSKAQTTFQAYQLMLIAALRLDRLNDKVSFGPFLASVLEQNTLQDRELNTLFRLSQGAVTIEEAKTVSGESNYLCQCSYYYGCWLKTNGNPAGAILAFEEALRIRASAYERSLALLEMRVQLWKYFRQPSQEVCLGVPALLWECSQRTHEGRRGEAIAIATEIQQLLRSSPVPALEFAMAASDLAGLNLRLGRPDLCFPLLDRAVQSLLPREAEFPGLQLGLIWKYSRPNARDNPRPNLAPYLRRAIPLYPVLSDNPNDLLNGIKEFAQKTDDRFLSAEGIIAIKQGIELLKQQDASVLELEEARRVLVDCSLRVRAELEAARNLMDILDSVSGLFTPLTEQHIQDLTVWIWLCRDADASEHELDKIRILLKRVPAGSDLLPNVKYQFATMLQKRGDHWHAIELLRELLVHPLLKSDTSVNYALATSYRAVGDLASARVYVEKCRGAALALSSREQALSLVLDAEIAFDEGDPARAELALREAAKLPMDVEIESAFANVVTGYYGPRGNYSALAPWLESVGTRRGGGSLPRSALNNLGVAAMAEGDIERADSYFGRALERYNIASEGNSAWLSNYAALNIMKGDIESGILWFTRAMEAENSAIASMLAAASERQRLSFLSRIHKTFESFVSLALSLRDNTRSELILQSVLQRKGIDLELLTVRRSLQKPATEEVQSILDNLAAIRSDVVKGAWRRPGSLPDAVETLNGRLDSLEQQYAAVLAGQMERTLIKIMPSFVAERLGPNEALVEYFVYHEYDFSRAFNSAGSARYGVATLRGGGGNRLIQAIDLGEASSIDTEIRNLLNLMQSEIPWVISAEEELREICSILYDRLISPIRSALDECDRLKIAPDGQLSLLPFDLLVDETGSHLIDRFKIDYLACGRELVKEHSLRSSAGDVVVACPDLELTFHSSSGSGRSLAAVYRSGLKARGLHFENFLEGALREGAEVARRLGCELWHGPEALDRRVKQITSPRVLHFATHGFFRPRSEENLESGTFNSELTVAFPFESGLVLAGANAFLRGEALPEDAEDGFLFADEIVNMDLTGTKLVTLSVCESAVGNVMCGEGVTGLRRAFLAAGAETVVATLWEIDDERTAQFMTQFYDGLLAGLTCAEALLLAKNELRGMSECSPRDWAGFICLGNGGSRITETTPRK